MMRKLALAALLLLAAGCLPPGDPPAGNVIENGEKLNAQLKELTANLQKYSDGLDSGDKEALRALLAEGNERKLEIDVKNNREQG